MNRWQAPMFAVPLLLAAAAGCSGTDDPPAAPSRAAALDPLPHTPVEAAHALPDAVDGADTRAIALAVDTPFAELVVPDDSRGGKPLARYLPLDRLEAQGGDDRTGYRFEMPVPFKPRGIYYSRAPDGMLVQQGRVGQLPYRVDPRRATHLAWSYDRDTLTVYSPTPDTPADLELSYPKAVDREARMHLQLALARGLVDDKADFVREVTVQDGWSSRTGLLLPAPGKAAFDLTLPPAAVFSFAPGLARPEFADLGVSDGCQLIITLEAAGEQHTLFDRELLGGSFEIERLDLSRWSGQDVRLVLSSQPGDSALYDFCFLGEPIISPRKREPKRVLMVFVDTVRADHLSLYGYERPTSPNLERFATEAAVFTQARSVAPWTLPSTRTVVTGRHPELYDSARTLPQLLGAQGFATGMIAGNVYLTANFGMQRGWHYHEVGLYPPANEVTDDALRWLAEHEGQDSLLLVHYMSAHLPYREPEPFRSMWAGEGPASLGERFVLRDVRTAERQGFTDADKQYIRDRYDQSLTWIDHELARLLGAMGDDDVVVVFSDHGEEFWDHGGYEHGHTLYDELLRVPLVVRAPGIQAGRFDTPVSLLDVTPTILDALGLPHDGLDGTPLTGVTRGDAVLTQALTDRPQVFGRPLYGLDRWGVLHQQKKWTSHRGEESLFDLSADPGEQKDLGGNTADFQPYYRHMADVLATDAGVAYRFLPSYGGAKRRDLVIDVQLPGGIERAWAGGDPHQLTPVTIEPIDAESVRITWHRGNGGREVYVLPKRPIAEVTPLLNGGVSTGAPRWAWKLPDDAPATPDQGRKRLEHLNMPEGAIGVYWGMAPAPPRAGQQLDATDDESNAELEALGYRDPDPADAD